MEGNWLFTENIYICIEKGTCDKRKGFGIRWHHKGSSQSVYFHFLGFFVPKILLHPRSWG